MSYTNSKKRNLAERALIQAGLAAIFAALAPSGLAVADGDGAPLGAWTFNLSFDLSNSLYSEES